MRAVKDGELATGGDGSDDLEVAGVEGGRTWGRLEREKEVSVEPRASIGHVRHFECFEAADVMMLILWCAGGA